MRFDVKKKDGIEKLDLLLIIESNMPQNTSELTAGARSFCASSLKPVLGCLKHHFKDNKEAFLAKWNLKKGISSFQKKCCCGLEDKDACYT